MEAQPDIISANKTNAERNRTSFILAILLNNLILTLTLREKQNTMHYIQNNIGIDFG